MTDLLTPEQRFAAGQARRKQMRRVAHAAWSVKLRRSEPLALLHRSMQGRVTELISLKYARLAESPFGYFRGAVPVMACDLSVLPNTGLVNQICGDAHVRNLGAFAAPDGRLVFDINDFDETIQAPFEWDVKRLATSLVLAARQGGARTHSDREAAATFVRRYCRFLHSFATMPVLDVARYQVHRLHDVEPISTILDKAERQTAIHTLLSLTQPKSPGKASKSKKSGRGKKRHPSPERFVGAGAPAGDAGGVRIFKSAPPVLERLKGKAAQSILDGLVTYRHSLEAERQHLLDQYRPVDVAFKVVGTGSVAMRDYCIYLEGNGAGDPLFLQVKEESPSAYAPYVKEIASSVQHQGRRVVDGQRAMQLQSDPFLGWTSIDGRDYLVRQLNDHKASTTVEDLSDSGLSEYATVCGEILARSHARSGDVCALAGYVGESGRFEEAILKFAVAYADQTERDWKQLVRSRRK